MLGAVVCIAFVAAGPAAAQDAPAEGAQAVAPYAPTLADLRALIARADRASDAAARHELLVEALQTFDRLSVSAASGLDGFDGPAFLADVADSDLAFAVRLPSGTEQQARILEGVRDVLPRIRDSLKQAELYVSLAHLELTSNDPSDAMASIRKANAMISALPASKGRDEARIGLIRLVLPMDNIEIDMKFGWSVQIGDPRLARTAMRAVAMSEVARRRASKQLFALAAVKDADLRTARLLGHGNALASKGSFRRSLVTALAISDAHAAQRDTLLAAIVQAQLQRSVRPESIIAPYAIVDDPLRESMLVRVSDYAIDRGRLAMARGIVKHLATPSARYGALSAIASRLAREQYVMDWGAVWDQATAAADMIADDAAQQAAYLHLAIEAAALGDAPRAEAVRARIAADFERELIVRHLVVAEVASGRIDGAIARFDLLESTAARSPAAAALYDALLAAEQPERAARMLPAITLPTDRIAALLADAKYLAQTAADQVEAGKRVDAARELLPEIADRGQRDERLAAVAGFYAQDGDTAAIDGLLRLATPEGRNRLVPLRAAAVARAAGSETALAGIQALPPGLRDRSLSEISSVLADNGDPIGGFDAARKIANDHVRRRALRHVAEEQARAQRHKSDDAGVASPAPPIAAPAGKGMSIAADQFLLSSVVVSERRKLPDSTAAASVTGDDIRRLVPTVAPGVARLVPTGFSNFDEKFSYIRYLNNVDFNGDEEELLARGQGTLFPHFILVEDGVFDLPTLKALLETAGDPGGQPITNNGRVYQLNVPLLIGRDATLVVTSSDVEELRLNTSAHSYIVNSGRLFIVDSRLTSWDPAAGAPTPRSKGVWNDFSPFYTAWSGSETYIADAHVNGMGYANGKSYGISISSGPINVLKATLDTVPRPKGIITDSTFTDMYYAFYSYEADDFQLVGNEYSGNEIYAIDPHDRSSRLTIAYNSAYGTRVKHGIITSREVRDSAIVGNLSADNHGSGFMLDRSSDGNVVAYNLAFRNGGDGLTIYESSCNLVVRNSFAQNRRDGIKLRNSWDLLVADNSINDNHGFGVNLYASRIEDLAETADRDFALDPYTSYANMTALGNTIDGSGKSALRGVAASSIVLAENRLSVDANKLFQRSDFARLGPTLLSLAGRGAGLRNTCLPVRPAVPCRFVEEGYFGADLIAELEGAGQTAQCASAIN